MSKKEEDPSAKPSLSRKKPPERGRPSGKNQRITLGFDWKKGFPIFWTTNGTNLGLSTRRGDVSLPQRGRKRQNHLQELLGTRLQVQLIQWHQNLGRTAMGPMPLKL